MSTNIDDGRHLEDDSLARWWLWPAARAHHFRSICDCIPSLITLVTPAGEIQIANRHALQYSGVTPGELYGRATTESIHPDDLAGVTAAWSEAIRSCRPFGIEARRRGVDGTYRWFDIQASPLPDTRERVTCWYLLERDIDDQKRAEALLAGEKRLLEMVAGGQSMAGVLEALCELVEATASGCHCSVVLVDRTGKRLEHGAAPSLPATFIASINGREVTADSGPCAMAAYLKEQVISADLTVETRWAAAAWCPMAMSHGLRSCWSTPITSSARKSLGAFAVYHDQPRAPTPLDLNLIEQLKHIARIAIERTLNDLALRRSQACLAGGQKLSLTGSFIWNVLDDQHFWSDETYRILEYDASTSVTTQLILDRVLAADVPQMKHALDLAAQGKSFDIECRARMPGGAVKHLHIVAHGSRDRDGRLECVAAIQDVTQHRLSEEVLDKVRAELAHVSRITTLGEMTASIAHEVNQPLTSIIANATTGMRFLALDSPDIGRAREAVQRTIRDGKHAADVVRGLRAMFRKQRSTVEPVDVNAALQEVIALSRCELQSSRVIVHTELANDLPPIRGDRVQLQQVILNLVRNAAEAMGGIGDRPKTLTIRTARERGDGVRVSVQDAGLGLEPEKVERLFDAFYTTKSSGMGIGLSVSRSIIEGHGGRLWATPNEGPGATFSFSIPRRVDQTQTQVENTATPM